MNCLFMLLPAEGKSVAYSVSPLCYILICVIVYVAFFHVDWTNLSEHNYPTFPLKIDTFKYTSEWGHFHLLLFPLPALYIPTPPQNLLLTFLSKKEACAHGHPFPIKAAVLKKTLVQVKNWFIEPAVNLSTANSDMPTFANSVDPDQLASKEACWSGSVLFVIKYVNLYQQTGSSNLIGQKLKVGVAS